MINTTWKVIGKKYEKYMLRIKHPTFFGNYVGDAFQRNVNY
jgi:hypothetical protein